MRGFGGPEKQRRRRRSILVFSVITILLLNLVPQVSSIAGGSPPAPSSQSTGRITPAISPVTTPEVGTTLPTATPAPSPVKTPVFPQSERLCLVERLAWCPSDLAPNPASPVPLTSGNASWLNLTPSPLPASYPSARSGASLAYSPDAHGSILFGGSAASGLQQDTWLFAGGAWSELINPASCTSTTCPSPRTQAMFAYDQSDHEAVLFGGLSAFGYPVVGVLNDTWVYSGGTWSNVTGKVGPAPPPRYDGSMVFDSGDGYVLLFGGANATSMPYDDTWTFVGGHWTNLTGSLTFHPEARMGAAIGNSPLGWVMLFGGLGVTSLIQNDYAVNTGPYVAWWFHNGTWTWAQTPINPQVPSTRQGASDRVGPCGRVDAALAWSPKNNHFVLFGGLGVPGTVWACGSSIFLFPLNDTYVYTGPPGSVWANWFNDTTAGPPAARDEMAYTSDYSAGYFLVFGGTLGNSGPSVGDTWRYFQRVTMKFSGPFEIQTGQLGFDEFLLTAVGGSGVLSYSANTTSLKILTKPLANCSDVTDGLPHPLPQFGYLPCDPPTNDYNIYRITVHVWDDFNGSDRASANWTVTVNPPEAIHLYSQFTGYFYEGFQMDNIFGVYAQIGNAPVTGVGATIQGNLVTFSHSNSSNLWWNSSAFNMGTIGPGAVLQVTASVSDWSESANLSLSFISIPDWLQQLVGLAGGLPIKGLIQTTTPVGKGPFGLSYFLTQKVPIPIGDIFNVSIPVPLVSGNYSLVPSLQFTFQETSSGNVTLQGQFTLSTPSITIGAFSLTISASVQVSGTFALVDTGGGTYDINWLQASVVITIKGDFKATIPLYGFSFDFLGATVKVGFNLDIEIAPSIALNILLLPTANNASDVAQGFGLAVSQLLGDFTLPISADVSFGIGIASVAIGGNISLDLSFEVAPGPFALAGLWVNGSMFVSAQIFFWSGSWPFVGPGIIYHWSPSLIRPRFSGGVPPTVPYGNGSNATWSVLPRYYNTSGYNSLVWLPSGTAGTAVSDVYPVTQPTAAPAYNGADLFYASDQVDRPSTQGLTITGVHLDSTTNTLSTLPSPPDPGFLLSNPKSTGLPDGSLYVLWDAIPISESGASSPLGLSAVSLHGARFYPSNSSWGPVRSFTSSGFVQSYALDASSAPGTVAVLRTPTLVPTASTPEWLQTFDLEAGTALTNATVSGVSSIDSLRAATGWASVGLTDGNISLLHVASGSPYSLPSVENPVGTLVSASFVPGSSTTLLLRYRSHGASELLLYNIAANTTLASMAGDASLSDAHALYSAGTYYVLAATAAGMRGWQVAGGAVSNLSVPAPSGITRFGLTQAGGSLLVYSVVPTTGGQQPLKAIVLAEVPAALPAPPPPPSATQPPTSSGSSPNYLLYLAIAGIAVVLLLAVVAVWSRRRSPPKPEATVPPHAGSEPPPQGSS
ncbi:MAG TPA: kelch repeat-containing protein [Thermoplasmata archaeon]|nr:kelch repeat-containing protein [Thermoplasmata archaeon]